MILAQPPSATTADGPVSPLNAVWCGHVRQRIILPQLGHVVLVFPLGETAVICANTSLEASQYLMLAAVPDGQPITLGLPDPQAEAAPLLVMWLSPAFVAELAQFLNIPENLHELLQGMPLLQGDPVSAIVAEVEAAYRAHRSPDAIEDLFLEVVGEVLRLMRLRHQTLQRLARRRDGTTEDLVPRLLRARQFVEARFTQDIPTAMIARYVALSEAHFTRLFKAAFDITPHQYVIHLRLEAARRWLEPSEPAITEIALRAGYGSLSNFIHAFSRRFGLSPGQYRNRARSEQDLTSPAPP